MDSKLRILKKYSSEKCLLTGERKKNWVGMWGRHVVSREKEEEVVGDMYCTRSRKGQKREVKLGYLYGRKEEEEGPASFSRFFSQSDMCLFSLF